MLIAGGPTTDSYEGISVSFDVEKDAKGLKAIRVMDECGRPLPNLRQQIGARHTGTVVEFNEERGFGRIQCLESEFGIVFFVRSALMFTPGSIRKGKKFKDAVVKNGQTLTFTLIKDMKGFHAEDVRGNDEGALDNVEKREAKKESRVAKKDAEFDAKAARFREQGRYDDD